MPFLRIVFDNHRLTYGLMDFVSIGQNLSSGDCPNYCGISDIAFGKSLTAAKMGLSPSCRRGEMCGKNTNHRVNRNRPSETSAVVPPGNVRRNGGFSKIAISNNASHWVRPIDCIGQPCRRQTAINSSRTR